MDHATMAPLDREIAVTKLDRAIAETGNKNDLIAEHLRCARSYLLGAMPDEYVQNLRMAQESISTIRDSTLRSQVEHEIENLLEDFAPEAQTIGKAWHEPVHPTPPEERDRSKSELYRFLVGPKTSMGVFYPRDYIIATLPSFAIAKDAKQVLHEAGFSDSECLAVSGDSVLRFFQEVRSDTGLSGEIMSRLSRFFATEEAFVDADTEKAREGAGFLAIWCPREEEAPRIAEALSRFKPLSMQLYLTGGIQSLI